MNINNKRHITSFFILGGFIIFLFHTVMQVIILSNVPQPADWCLDAVEYSDSGSGDTRTLCIEYKNDLEMRKYYHNKKQLTKNKYIVMPLSAAFGGLLAVLFFSYIPMRRRGGKMGMSNVGGSFVFGVAVWLIMILVYGAILPPPVEWFPDVITEYALEKQENTLRMLGAD